MVISNSNHLEMLLQKSNPGQPGNAMWVRLRLNLIADVGIIGLPNVGKSSFLKS